VQVARDGGLPQVEEAGEALARGVPRVEGFGVLYVADMLGQEAAGRAVRVLAREGERGLLLASARQDAGVLRDGGVLGGGRQWAYGQRKGLRSVPAGAAHGHGGTVDDAHHGVVVAREDVAVVAQQGVGDAGGDQVLPGKLVVCFDGFFADVAAGHD